ncbi:MAG: putative signal transducing protein [Planctomycetota bacterium]
MTEVIVCRGLLESNGIPTHVLDENMKVIDPFITGADVFSVQLQVADDRAAEAKEILDYRPPPDPEAEPGDPVEERVRQLGLRIRWASVVIFTAPYALWLAWPYFSAAKRLGRRPAEHGWTIGAIVYSAVLIFAILSVVLT